MTDGRSEKLKNEMLEYGESSRLTIWWCCTYPVSGVALGIAAVLLGTFSTKKMNFPTLLRPTLYVFTYVWAWYFNLIELRNWNLFCNEKFAPKISWRCTFIMDDEEQALHKTFFSHNMPIQMKFFSWVICNTYILLIIALKYIETVKILIQSGSSSPWV